MEEEQEMHKSLEQKERQEREMEGTCNCCKCNNCGLEYNHWTHD